MNEPSKDIPATEAHLVTQKKQPRKKTARACVNCHKAHMTCDSGRPCKRCVNKGLEDTCADAPRKLKKYLLLDTSGTNSPSSRPVTPTPPVNSGSSQTLTNPLFNTTTFQGSDISNVLGMNQQQQQQQQLILPLQQQQSQVQPSLHSHGLMNPIPIQPQSQLYRSSVFNSANIQKSKNTYNNSIRHTLMGGNSDNNNNNNQAPVQLIHMDPSVRHRNKFMSNAINNEYFSLGEIIKQEEGTSPYPQSTVSPPNILDGFKPNVHRNSSDTPTSTSSLNHSHEIYQSMKSGKSINQYTLGYVQDRIVTLPDTLAMIEGERTLSGETQSGTDKTLSFAIHLKDSSSTKNNNEQSLSESGLRFKEAECIYSKINKPFSYTPGFHALHKYLQSRFSKPDLIRMAKSIAVYRPSFIACTNTLKEADLIFMEQCFQRTLLEYDKFISISGTPTIVWRRTGQIAYVSEEFCVLTGWTREQLLKKMTFIVELMDNISVIEYFDLFSTIAYGDFRGATMTGCTLLTPNNTTLKTTCIWTLKRDVFGIPMMIIGNFLPIL